MKLEITEHVKTLAVIQSVGTITVLLRQGGHKSVKAPSQSDAVPYPNNKHYHNEICANFTLYFLIP